MHVLIFSDPHWCQNSSIVRSRGNKYSTRLENLIESINWVEQLAWNNGCDCVICCGDFFDAAVLNSEEISALQEINWAPLSHLWLTGNHETNVSSLEYSTSDLFKLCPNSCVISSPQQYFIDGTTVEFCFMPYVLERDRKTILEYFGPKSCNRVIFSHNDLKNVQYGSFMSTEGFDISDIASNCDLYFNGHIHNCCNVTEKIINIGNLTGQNFTEDATKYSHCAIILDTETLKYKYFVNPYALKFYKLDATSCLSEEDVQHVINEIGCNGVVTLHVNQEHSDFAKAQLDLLKRDFIQDYRLIIKRESECKESFVINVASVDHLKQFESYALENFGSNDIVIHELNNLLR